MLEEKTNIRSKDIKGTETYGKRPATMNQTHQVIGTCAAHISWNLRSRDSEVELNPQATFNPDLVLVSFQTTQPHIPFINYLTHLY